VVGGPVGGVGQRVLSGVAKRTAGEFFQAVDGVLNGATAPAATGASATQLGVDAGPLDPAPQHPSATGPTAAATGSTAAAEPAVFRRPAVEPTRGPVPVDVHNQLAGVVLGALLALAGVWLGWRLGRRR